MVTLTRKIELDGEELEFNQKIISELNERVRTLREQLRSYKSEMKRSRDLSRTSFLGGGGKVENSKKRLEQCSKMAQEIITLRSDLSRSPFKCKSESP